MCACVSVGSVWKCTGAGVCLRACSPTYLPRNEYAPYCHLRPLWLQHIFHYIYINGTIFGKKLLNTKCVLWCSLRLLSEMFLNLRRISRDSHKRENVFIESSRYSRRILIKLKFSRQIFAKSSNIKFTQNPSSLNRVVPCRRTDMTELIVAFRNFANAPKMVCPVVSFCAETTMWISLR